MTSKQIIKSIRRQQKELNKKEALIAADLRLLQSTVSEKLKVEWNKCLGEYACSFTAACTPGVFTIDWNPCFYISKFDDLDIISAEHKAFRRVKAFCKRMTEKTGCKIYYSSDAS